MWTIENRCRYDRDHLRYPSDLTNAEWALIAPLIPPAKRGGGRKREVDEREIVDGIMYVLGTGCQWRAIPKEPAAAQHGARLPRALAVGRHAGAGPPRTLRPVPRDRRAEASPTVGIIDSQSVKSAEKGGAASTCQATTRARR